MSTIDICNVFVQIIHVGIVGVLGFCFVFCVFVDIEISDLFGDDFLILVFVGKVVVLMVMMFCDYW